MVDLEGDLNATRGDVIANAERLVEIEREKGRLAPTDPRLVESSDEAEEIANRLRSATMAERELAERVAESDAT